MSEPREALPRTTAAPLPPAPDPGTTDSEPALTVGGAGAVVTAGLVLLVSFGVPISDKQQSAVLALIATAVPFLVALWIRLRVYSPRSVARLLAAARQTGRQPPIA